MKTTLLLLVLVLSAYTAYPQHREIYVNPNFEALSMEHQTLAILPFKAIIKLRPKQMESMPPEQLAQLQEGEGMAVQSALLSYFLKRKDQHAFAINFLDLGTTNALLAKNNIDQSNIDAYTPRELAQILEVDGIISGMLLSDKPMSEGAAVAMGILVGVYGPTNSGKCTININDGATGELLWKYDKTLSRSLGSDTNTIINAMMRKASRQLPYITE
ncbi:hypothetical protein OKW21_003073 [Catalinimonas alkaloidigena]|uniref:hypothetical protein n=1 Tax=Catalinimonas alkaloidigena TaxID=1075417 RepID=UPI002405492F|nr:hypothetical protein [Catalinimonas alkaloidigena]MDF9797810.1 hypothetical protein [Catalinimonas alkaloidigena]